MSIVTEGSVHEYGGIQQLSTAGTFPSVKGTNEIIEFLGKHATPTARTLHKLPSP